MNARARIPRSSPPRSLVWAALISSWFTVSACASALDHGLEAQHAGDVTAAEEHFRAATKEGSVEDRAEATRLLTEILLERGKSMTSADPEGARAVYSEILALDPTVDEARLGVARANMRLGKFDEALATLDASAGCRGCERLKAVLLYDRGQQYLGAGELEKARADFEAALKLRADGLAALGIVESYALADARALAVEAMDKALATIASDDQQAQAKFAELRRKLVVAAAAQRDQALVDRYMAMRPPGAGGDEWFSLQLAVAEASYVQGDADGAIERVQRLIAESSDIMSESRRKEMADALVSMYSIRAARRLRVGDVAAAENDLTFALRVDPDNPTVTLQRVLAVVALGKLDYAFRMVEKTPADTPGRKQVLAILFSYRVEEQVAAGDLEAAQKSLELAQKADEDTPETHLAAALILERTPVEGLPSGASAELKRSGLMHRAGGQIRRVGEALSELDWARTQAEGLGDRYAWHGPNTEQRMRALEDRIRAHYRPVVRFQADPTTVLVLEHKKSDALKVEVDGPGGFSRTAEVPGGGSVEIVVPESGLVRLGSGGEKRSLVAEPYTKLVIEL